jgi:hypothetical protein
MTENVKVAVVGPELEEVLSSAICAELES